ncbi:sensor histidine kinase [Palleronia sp. LCG004]|uniref:sensor histidine kinase n=1 Tax=Palleronia sp. LCG004 TaxID=3079304 RepID=UPI0029426682|nr:ATP-binding protein [Palleronia sp. LCG004]WOI57949.1 ATP-binding protein [Palleronia sp. LCG004]
MSIRLRLILTLLAATVAVWLSAVLWIQHSTRAKVEDVLDARLAESARMVSSLLADRRIDVADASTAFEVPMAEDATYSRQLTCQIWSLSGALIGQSSGAPETRLTDGTETGYAFSSIDGERWRVYTVVNPALGVRVMVGDNVAVRDRLVRDVIGGLLWPAAVVLPGLAVLIWIGIAGGLAPLDRLAASLREREASDFSPLPAGSAPAELRPVRTALDGLFARAAKRRETERDFTAFAAHELKTPLAGLKTQAWVARRAEDDATRSAALQEIETSVTRTDRLVRQLLELTTVEGDHLPAQVFGLDEIVSEVEQELASLAADRGVSIVTEPIPANLAVPRFLLHAAIRNVLENALLASGAGGTVRVRAACDTHRCRIEVADDGPGIPEAIRDIATDRFVRGRSGPGSGLGLAIVAVAMERLGGTLELMPDRPGQTVRLTVPCDVRPGGGR